MFVIDPFFNFSNIFSSIWNYILIYQNYLEIWSLSKFIIKKLGFILYFTKHTEYAHRKS